MKVLVVDDSILARGMIKSLLESLGLEVIGEAGNGKKAIDAVKALRPDLLLMDVNMPEMDGITATGKIMEECPLPIIIFTSEDIAEVGFKALNLGALEVVPKPDIHQMNNPEFKATFKTILENVSRFGSFKLKNKSGQPSSIPSPSDGLKNILPGGKKFTAAVIGASTGGPSAVRTVLQSLPGDFPLPILLAQHIEEGFDKGYAEWLNEAAALKVRVAEERDKPVAGEVLVAPATHHLICNGPYAIWDDGPRVDNQKPSINKMFESAAGVYKDSLLGVLLTGMGADGARGCKKIIETGGETLVQDAATSMIFGMPKAAIEMNAATLVLPLQDIGKAMIRKASGK